MKLTRLAPALSLLTLVLGSAAFAQSAVKFRYDVGGGAPAIMSNAAVVAPAACGSAQVLTQPAVLGGCCDPYLPLWQQATIDTIHPLTSPRVCGLPGIAYVAPACNVMSRAAVIENGCGDALIQPALIDSACGTGQILPQGALIQNSCGAQVMTQPAVMDSNCGAQMLMQPAVVGTPVINQPVYIRGVEPSDVHLVPAPIIQP